ncbi:hypothetical protein [Shewanella surugensis]|uniref:Uncharacterized protein n=1 Tax=Shewanella surugensis TaxID=212020 RepID=A0ABT0LJM9_9GAMM|nr:hypothetical protein [Shewanella surugensis]MCL1127497.1 hypothetical protein [Shewanella surugensis]
MKQNIIIKLSIIVLIEIFMCKPWVIFSFMLFPTSIHAAAESWSPYVTISELFIEGEDSTPRATLEFETPIPDSYQINL